MTDTHSSEKRLITIHIPADLFDALAKEAEREGLTVHQHASRVLSRALRDPLDP